MTQLAERISLETGVEIRDAADAYKLSGVFNRYRPSGVGLERLLSSQGVEGKVLARLKLVFDAVAADWTSDDVYFSLRRHPPITEDMAVKAARAYLDGIRKIASYRADRALLETLLALKVEYRPNAPSSDQSETATAIYECVTDLLSEMQPEANEIFLLHEAIYSMANDYFLAAYVLWPAIETTGAPAGAMDGYFDLWRHGLHTQFESGHRAVVSLQA